MGLGLGAQAGGGQAALWEAVGLAGASAADVRALRRCVLFCDAPLRAQAEARPLHPALSPPQSVSFSAGDWPQGRWWLWLGRPPSSLGSRCSTPCPRSPFPPQLLVLCTLPMHGIVDVGEVCAGRRNCGDFGRRVLH